MGRLLTDGCRRELDLIFSFDHIESPGHSRFDEYRYDLPYLKRFYMDHLNADCGNGWNTLFFNNHDNPRMLSKIDPSGKYAVPLAKLLAALQLTLRGTPFIYQGDEAGMQNGNFTSIDEIQDVESLNLYAELCRTMSPDAAFRRVLAGTRDHGRVPLQWEDIERQRTDPDSVLHFYRELTSLRRSSPVLTYGDLHFLHPKDKTLFCYTRSKGNETFYVEANLSPKRRRSKAPRGAKLLLCNYGKPELAGGILRPYEASISQISLMV
jgi:oligo-1,6-glucosidase